MGEEPRRGPPVIEIVLPTYITKPGEAEKFYPSEVKEIAHKVHVHMSPRRHLVDQIGAHVGPAVMNIIIVSDDLLLSRCIDLDIEVRDTI